MDMTLGYGQADVHCSIRTGRLAEQGVMKELSKELRQESMVILKYFDHKDIVADIDYLGSILG